MPEHPSPSLQEATLAEHLAQLEARLARLETKLGLADDAAPVAPPPAAAVPAAAARVAAEPVTSAPKPQEADELELEVGQTWFARVGILVLALGAGFMLTLPYPQLPAYVPSLGGLAVAAALLLVARMSQRDFELVASYLRGAGMALLYCATLRLFFFGAQPALKIEEPAAPFLLNLAAALNLVLALRRNSPWLTGLALLTGCASVLAVGSAAWALGGLTAVAATAAITSIRRRWPAIALVGLVMVLGTYALWAVGNPFRGGAFHFVTGPLLAPAFLLLYALAFGVLPLFQPAADTDDPANIAGGLATCALAYGLFLVHTAAAFPKVFAVAQAGAAAVFLGLAVLFWRRRHSRISTFFYAMTGYTAISMAIIKLSASPNVFVWLSLQSVAVVTTAIWFRSRSIVVANFLIYVAIVLAYAVLKKSETGISLGFGVVALVSARILNWQKHRLELKTELMRNAYLLSGFVIFPYALYHLLPAKFVGFAWIAMALVYYVLNFAVRNRKYRWMGHGTLLLTAVYLVVAGGGELEPAWRISSFLVLGAVLLIVSLTFTRLQRRERGAAGG